MTGQSGSTVTLQWSVYPERYGFMRVPPENVYLGAILNPERSLENRAATVSEVLGTSGRLYVYYATASKKKKHGKRVYTYGWHPYPPAVPGWENVVFPLAGRVYDDTMEFTAPAGINQRCVFVGAFLPFPNAAPEICEVSNGFDLP